MADLQSLGALKTALTEAKQGEPQPDSPGDGVSVDQAVSLERGQEA